MSKVLNRIAFGGDITKAIDRKDSETAMIIIEGATDDVILQTCDTENGTFEDFSKIAEYAENLFVGVQLKIDGCKKFVKVIGAEKASVVFGDTKYNPSDFIPVGSAGGGESLKYHLYAWDYSNGTAIAYSEKALPQAGDVVFLKQDMEGGKITDTNELKLIYHVVSDSDGVITVSEHPEGTTGGYTFNRNESDDYEEEVTDVRDVVDIAQNGLYLSAKGSMFKALNTNVEGGGASNYYGWGTPWGFAYTCNDLTDLKIGDKLFRVDNVIEPPPEIFTITNIDNNTITDNLNNTWERASFMDFSL